MTEEASKDPSAPAAPDSRPVPNVPFPVVPQGQPALVTGANSGIGKAVALGLARPGRMSWSTTSQSRSGRGGCPRDRGNGAPGDRDQG